MHSSCDWAAIQSICELFGKPLNLETQVVDNVLRMVLFHVDMKM
jgi:hypothetical protein